MTSVASRELRNHTAAVLRRVSEGADVTVTVNGLPVALITRPRSQRPIVLTRDELAGLQARAASDHRLRADLAWISGDTTDDLGNPA
ncbi:type II toxin-antitoxin system Phd/YefM family antitoxin [Micropruina sp.]|uniref:type II toxin-antitoxin system Phd/YefM family antitoxin n=1 Tax=Micropruina sp. TaxID=2737536 RepID=UPI0039E69652